MSLFLLSVLGLLASTLMCLWNAIAQLIVFGILYCTGLYALCLQGIDNLTGVTTPVLIAAQDAVADIAVKAALVGMFIGLGLKILICLGILSILAKTSPRWFPPLREQIVEIYRKHEKKESEKNEI